MDQSPRVVLLVVLLLFIFLSPDPQSLRRLNQFDEARLGELRRHDLDVIANSTYGTPDGLNLTGFRPHDGYQWQLISQAQAISRNQSSSWQIGTRYRHINGEVKGAFKAHPVATDGRQPNLTALAGDSYWTRQFQRNVTDGAGEISLLLQDSTRDQKSREIKAALSIYTATAPGNGWEANLQGVHFQNGSAIFTTASRKFNALPALPHFALNEDEYHDAQHVMNKTITRLWDQLPTADISTSNVPNCELIVWLQQKPIEGSEVYVKEVEGELENPEGAPIGQPPLLDFAVTIFSPDCAYILEAELVVGKKSEMYWSSARQLLAGLILLVALQITLLKRQMERCATPSTRSRISYYSIGIAAFGDGLILFSMIGMLMIEARAFFLFAAAAFVCTMHVAFFEVKFIFDIWTVQVGDPAQAQRQRQRRNMATQQELPPPVTARTDGAAPIVTPDQDEPPRASFASLYSKFYFGLVNLIFFSLWATSWPPGLRAIYTNTLAFLYLSMWFPQIWRNVIRNCRKALSWEYVIGSSVLRVIPVLYWYVDEQNILAAEPNQTAALFLLGWVWMQILILVSQQYLGPRLLVKDSWCPPAYDYHPILFDDLEAGGLPIGEVASASEGKDKDNKTRKVFDCAICMNEIDVPVVAKDENTGRGWLEQRNYMVTPCRHIFHTECLEGWMNLRLICPVCRETLPPL